MEDRSISFVEANQVINHQHIGCEIPPLYTFNEGDKGYLQIGNDMGFLVCYPVTKVLNGGYKMQQFNNDALRSFIPSQYFIKIITNRAEATLDIKNIVTGVNVSKLHVSGIVIEVNGEKRFVPDYYAKYISLSEKPIIQ